MATTSLAAAVTVCSTLALNPTGVECVVGTTRRASSATACRLLASVCVKPVSSQMLSNPLFRKWELEGETFQHPPTHGVWRCMPLFANDCAVWLYAAVIEGFYYAHQSRLFWPGGDRDKYRDAFTEAHKKRFKMLALRSLTLVMSSFVTESAEISFAYGADPQYLKHLNECFMLPEVQLQSLTATAYPVYGKFRERFDRGLERSKQANIASFFDLNDRKNAWLQADLGKVYSVSDDPRDDLPRSEYIMAWRCLCNLDNLIALRKDIIDLTDSTDSADSTDVVENVARAELHDVARVFTRE